MEIFFFFFLQKRIAAVGNIVHWFSRLFVCCPRHVPHFLVAFHSLFSFFFSFYSSLSDFRITLVSWNTTLDEISSLDPIKFIDQFFFICIYIYFHYFIFLFMYLYRWIQFPVFISVIYLYLYRHIYIGVTLLGNCGFAPVYFRNFQGFTWFVRSNMHVHTDMHTVWP